MKKIFLQDFNYMPETYNFPEDQNLINNKFKNYTLNLKDLWLIKPSNSCGGNGISIFTSLNNIKLKEFVLTKYISDINLINNKKYDLRLFVLISGLKPLRIYFYREGFVRIATEKYSLNQKFLKNKYMHLTNSLLNKHNKKYISPNGTKDINANKWNIQMYKTFLKKYNIEWDELREKIKDIIIKSFISVYQYLINEIEVNNLNDQSFYEILGYDILITKDFIPKLMEINENPDMKFYSNLEKPIKTNIFLDALNLIGLRPYSRKTRKPFNNKIIFSDDIEEKINNALCELERPRGDYELIFPTKKTLNKYKKYFMNPSNENLYFWKKIESI